MKSAVFFIPSAAAPRRPRLYTGEDYEVLKKILHGKRLGFTIAEIRNIIGGDRNPENTQALENALRPEQILAQIEFMERQRDDINGALRTLRQAHRRAIERAPAKN